MIALNEHQVEQVSGGILPLVYAAGVVVGIAIGMAL